MFATVSPYGAPLSSADGETEDPAFHAILALLRDRTGTDFTRYRPATITRRVLNRMMCVGVQDFAQYLHLLTTQEHETQHLVERVTIKVSRFYRNSASFDFLRTQVIPELARRRAGQPVRIWSAGCGWGEEAHSLALLLEEADVAGRVLATDIDNRALQQAARAHYKPEALVELPVALRERFLVPQGEEFVPTDAVRKRVSFAYHDLTVAGPPPSGDAGFDLICCRNVLIYFARDVQLRAQQALRRALADGGYLCLGEAEWPAPEVAQMFEALPHKTRIFRALQPKPDRT